MSARIPTGTDQRSPDAGTPGRVGRGREGVVVARGNSLDFWFPWLANHLPGEHRGYAYIAVMHLYLREQRKDQRRPPEPEAVLAELRRMGKDAASLEAS